VAASPIVHTQTPFAGMKILHPING
jgi:hypothetical protein